MTREEAIKIIRDTYHTDTEFEALKVLIPEFQESEDERIGKFICSIIDNLEPKDFVGVKKMNVLAWLEKQKEQKPITINQDEKEFLADEITAFLCNYDKEFDGEDPVPSEVAEHFYLLGKQAQEQKPSDVIDPFSNANFVRGYESGYADAKREQKPVDDKAFEEWIDGWYNEHHRDGYITMDEREFKNFCRGIRNMYQQKPAEWSEEDKQNYKVICSIIHGTYVIETQETQDKLLSWLKSLKPQPMQEQKPAEWNEEDEDNLCRVIKVLEDNDSDWKELSNWLQSLRPRLFQKLK